MAKTVKLELTQPEMHILCAALGVCVDAASRGDLTGMTAEIMVDTGILQERLVRVHEDMHLPDYPES